MHSEIHIKFLIFLSDFRKNLNERLFDTQLTNIKIL